MKKKTLDEQMNIQSYNKALFDQAIKLINAHKKIPLGDVKHQFKDIAIK